MNKRTHCCEDDWVCDRSMEVGFQSLSIIHFTLFRLQCGFSVRMTSYPTIIIDAHIQRGYRTPHKSTSYTPSRGLTLISDSSATGLDAQPSPPRIPKKLDEGNKALPRRSSLREVMAEEAISIWEKSPQATRGWFGGEGRWMRTGVVVGREWGIVE